MICKCGHDGYAHGLPSSLVTGDSACDICSCPKWRVLGPNEDVEVED